MNRIVSSLLTAGLLIGMGLTVPAFAQTDASKSPSPSASKEKKTVAIPFAGKLSAIDKTAMSITLEGKTKKRTILIAPETKIMKAGKPATLEDAVVGEEVGGQVIKNGGGLEEAVSLRLGPKPEAEPRSKRRAKEEASPKEK
ncbi:MAG: hypothetical protein HY735_20485 [Verrucomicrobia bacterium]|nr:hypothetical protein [Verrucomicrobiota bacterium]